MENTFSTERLQLAAYLHASRRLLLSDCKPVGGGKATFLFDDPTGAGPQLELEYENGAACSAAALFASQKFLRRRVDQTLASELRRDVRNHNGR
jgi:hypothetical protein